MEDFSSSLTNTHNPLKDWTVMREGDDSFTRSFCVTVAADDARRLFLLPALRIPDFDDPAGKYLAFSCERIGGKAEMFALQVDQLGVCMFQSLEGCFDRVPACFIIHEELPHLVDFGGKGTVGVMLSGFIRKEKQDPVLCVLVLKVIAKRVVDHPTCVRSPRECEFLDWKVLGVHMYSMEGIHDWCPVSVFPNIQCHQENAQEKSDCLVGCEYLNLIALYMSPYNILF
ncbi:hypothetical protein PIB30_015444 [Stylosanthes scabra]|uniref:Uncharacterized protein n=1 Tax=Stylosanthes scabra TaxID=79078 RepID=A0ABU6UA40_9FABA|nr:hypothetical protein [Stylosanthes scabra]